MEFSLVITTLNCVDSEGGSLSIADSCHCFFNQRVEAKTKMADTTKAVQNAKLPLIKLTYDVPCCDSKYATTTVYTDSKMNISKTKTRANNAYGVILQRTFAVSSGQFPRMIRMGFRTE